MLRVCRPKIAHFGPRLWRHAPCDDRIPCGRFCWSHFSSAPVVTTPEPPSAPAAAQVRAACRAAAAPPAAAARAASRAAAACRAAADPAASPAVAARAASTGDRLRVARVDRVQPACSAVPAPACASARAVSPAACSAVRMEGPPTIAPPASAIAARTESAAARTAASVVNGVIRRIRRIRFADAATPARAAAVPSSAARGCLDLAAAPAVASAGRYVHSENCARDRARRRL